MTYHQIRLGLQSLVVRFVGAYDSSPLLERYCVGDESLPYWDVLRAPLIDLYVHCAKAMAQPVPAGER